MITITKSERALLYKVMPTEHIPKTRYHQYAPEEQKVMKVLAENGNNEAKEILKDRYGLDLKI